MEFLKTCSVEVCISEKLFDSNSPFHISFLNQHSLKKCFKLFKLGRLNQILNKLFVIHSRVSFPFKILSVHFMKDSFLVAAAKL